jgi:hypothetical protein
MPKLRLLPIERFEIWPISSIIKVLAAFCIVSGGGAAYAAQFGQHTVNGAVEAVMNMESEKLGDSQRNYDYLAHRYKLNTQSFVISPRLLTYQIGLSLDKGETHSNGDSSNIDNFGYNVRTTLLPGQRINANLYTSKDSVSNFTPMTSRSGSILVSQTNTLYGAAVNLNYPYFPMTISYDENQTKGAAGIQQIDRSVRRIQLGANKEIYGFAGSYGYIYSNTSDGIEQSFNSEDHQATVNLGKKFSNKMDFRQGLTFASTRRSGSFQDITANTVTKTADYTLTPADEIVRFDSTMVGLTAQLPAAVGYAGRIFTIVKIDATINRVTIKPMGNETINGANSLILQGQWAEVTLVSNGISWEAGSRTAKPGSQREINTMNLHSNSGLTYHLSNDFTNDSSLDLFYYQYGEGPGMNVSASNSTNFQVNSKLSLSANLSGTYADMGTTRSDTENASLFFNYRVVMAGWQVGVFENMGVNVSSQTTGSSKTMANVGLGASANRAFDWLRSSLIFQTQAAKTASSRGGAMFNWESSGTWNSLPTERIQMQSNLRYRIEDVTNDAILAATTTGAETTIQPFTNASRTISLDMNYSWLAYVSGNGTATLNGGAVFSRQESRTGAGDLFTSTDRSFFYDQIMLRMEPLRGMFISLNLRAEWDNLAMETSNAGNGIINGSVMPRTAYIIENEINFRIRKIFFQLQYNWRDETSTTSSYGRQSLFLKITRPF